jgi:hypothetical protein
MKMNKKMTVIGILLVLTLALAACGSGGDNNASAPEASATNAGTAATAVTLNDDYTDALPVATQLAIGTLLLEGTDEAVTVEQAGDLLPSWQMLTALQGSGTAAQAEMDAVLDQIQGEMTATQLTAIQGMQLTPSNILEMVQQGGGFGGLKGGGGQGGGFAPPAGVAPGGAGAPGGGFGAGDGTDLSPEEQEAALAERMNTQMGAVLSDMLVSLLEARAEGETVATAAPNQAFETTRVLLGVVAEATGLDQQAVMTQAREGQTLAEIAAANGADGEELVAQAVAAETARIDQAIADGTLDQSDADDLLADVETRIQDVLEQPLQFGGRGG